MWVFENRRQRRTRSYIIAFRLFHQSFSIFEQDHIIEALLQWEGCASQFVKALCFFCFSSFNPSYPSTNSTQVHTCPSIHFQQMFGNGDHPQQPKSSVAARSVERTSVSAILESTVVLPSGIKHLLLLGSGREISSTWQNLVFVPIKTIEDKNLEEFLPDGPSYFYPAHRITYLTRHFPFIPPTRHPAIEFRGLNGAVRISGYVASVVGWLMNGGLERICGLSDLL